MPNAIIFFENQYINWKRYPKFLSKHLNKYDLYFAYNVGKNVDDSKLFKKTYLYKGDISTILSDMHVYDSLTVITMSLRPIDLIFTTHLKRSSININIINIQHGVLSDKLERNSLIDFFKNTYDRIISYILTLFKAKLFDYKTNCLILLEIFRVYVINKKKLSQSRIITDFNLPDYALVFDTNWKLFFIDNLLGNKASTNFFYVPPRDLDLLNNIKVNNSSVLFIAQSLVEDGRYSEKLFRDELNLIFKHIPDKLDIIVKRHPRSNNNLYKNLCKEAKIIDELVLTDFVIGGYSSLLQILNRVGSNIFLWKYKNHYNPKSFESFATVYGREDKMKDFFKLNKPIRQIQKFYNPSKEYSKIINEIIKNKIK